VVLARSIRRKALALSWARVPVGRVPAAAAPLAPRAEAVAHYRAAGPDGGAASSVYGIALNQRKPRFPLAAGKTTEEP
jgi:hypothetical protein